MTAALVHGSHPDIPLEEETDPGDMALEGVLVEVLPSGRWLHLAQTADPGPDSARALAEGASAVLTLSSAMADWALGLKALFSDDQVHVAPEVLRWMASEALGKKGSVHAEARLTAREREVLALVSTGCSNAEIAGGLGISLSTVRTHLHTLSVKLETSSRALMVANAQALNLVDEPGSQERSSA